MAKTNVYFDFADVVVTPQGQSAINLTETTQIKVMRGDELDEWQSAGHRFSTVVVNTRSSRGCSIQGGDVNKLTAIPSGVPCVITGTILDAKNGDGEGAIGFTLNNALIQDTSFGGAARKFGGGGADFLAFSTDGNTDPMTLTIEPAPAP